MLWYDLSIGLKLGSMHHFVEHYDDTKPIDGLNVVRTKLLTTLFRGRGGLDAISMRYFSKNLSVIVWICLSVLKHLQYVEHYENKCNISFQLNILSSDVDFFCCQT